MIPEMCKAGDGYNVYVTGLTHDERGYPAMNHKAQEKLIRRLVDKIRLNETKIAHYEEEQIDGAEVVVISYGITSRVARRGVELARAKGVKVGILRLIVVWPFPETRVRELAPKVRSFVVPELNYGQVALEVERVAAGKCNTVLVPHGGGEVHDPEVIADAIMRAARSAF
jgi:2-oxoglutarate ferredoxin oxidoreductase subunit alpha